MRDVTLRLSDNRWVRGFSFSFLVLLATHLMNLPLGIYGHHIGLQYGLSVQVWASWLADKGKMFVLVWVVGSLLVMLVSWFMRKSPARWWFWVWIPTAPLVLAGVLITPYVIDPLFNHFEPLAQTNPVLVQRLEQVAARGALEIPTEPMFRMAACAK